MLNLDSYTTLILWNSTVGMMLALGQFRPETRIQKFEQDFFHIIFHPMSYHPLLHTLSPPADLPSTGKSISTSFATLSAFLGCMSCADKEAASSETTFWSCGDAKTLNRAAERRYLIYSRNYAIPSNDCRPRSSSYVFIFIAIDVTATFNSYTPAVAFYSAVTVLPCVTANLDGTSAPLIWMVFLIEEFQWFAPIPRTRLFLDLYR